VANAYFVLISVVTPYSLEGVNVTGAICFLNFYDTL